MLEFYYVCENFKMKQPLLLSLITLLFGLSATAQTQISILSTDMPVINDVLARKADTMTVLSPGPAGADQVWTMTNLSSYIINETTTVSAPSSTPYASSFPGANIALSNDGVSFVYMNINASTSTVVGASGDLLNFGTIFTIPFNPDILLHNFPRDYGSNFSDAYGWDITTSGASVNQPAANSVRTKRTSVVKDTTDAWGRLTTPVGTYDVLRVKRVDFSVDSNWFRLLPFGGYTFFSRKVDTAYAYTWLAKETKLAVAELAYDSLDHPKKFTWSLTPPQISIGLKEQNYSRYVEVYPSPANEVLKLNAKADLSKGEYQFSISNTLGQVVKSSTVFLNAESTVEIAISDLPKGIYSWNLKGKTTDLSGKLCVEH